MQQFAQLTFPEKSIIAGYSAIRSELDVFPAMGELGKMGHTLCLPEVEHKEAPLVFYRWSFGQKLSKGSYGIEVSTDSEQLSPDILLVPLVAFDRRGYRIGYGAGYYDQTISQLKRKKDIIAIGVAYEMQCVDKVPEEPHDQLLDMVITEKESIHFT